ncbi:MAG: polyamine aminopropyltransferase [Candidatus Firestonebacteria bacterium]
MSKKNKWIADYITNNEYHLYRVKKVLIDKKSNYQHIKLIETKDYGKCLYLNNHIQFAEKDEYIYHELLIHPALITHPKPRKVLVIGGGDGFALREILKHNMVKEVVVIDIDLEVVELMSKLNGKYFQDKRVKMIYGDGRKYLKDTGEIYDVIILDLSDPVKDGHSGFLFTKEFYKIVKDKLSKIGLMISQAISPIYPYRKIHIAIYNTLCSIFPVVKLFYAYIPSYGTEWGFALASKKYNPEDLTKDEIEKKLTKRHIKDLKYYHRDLHKGLFTSSKDLITDIRLNKKLIITDKKPLFV